MVKIFKPASFLKVSNSTPLKSGLFTLAQRSPRDRPEIAQRILLAAKLAGQTGQGRTDKAIQKKARNSEIVSDYFLY